MASRGDLSRAGIVTRTSAVDRRVDRQGIFARDTGQGAAGRSEDEVRRRSTRYELSYLKFQSREQIGYEYPGPLTAPDQVDEPAPIVVPVGSSTVQVEGHASVVPILMIPPLGVGEGTRVSRSVHVRRIDMRGEVECTSRVFALPYHDMATEVHPEPHYEEHQPGGYGDVTFRLIVLLDSMCRVVRINEATTPYDPTNCPSFDMIFDGSADRPMLWSLKAEMRERFTTLFDQPVRLRRETVPVVTVVPEVTATQADSTLTVPAMTLTSSLHAALVLDGVCDPLVGTGDGDISGTLHYGGAEWTIANGDITIPAYTEWVKTLFYPLSRHPFTLSLDCDFEMRVGRNVATGSEVLVGDGIRVFAVCSDSARVTIDGVMTYNR